MTRIGGAHHIFCIEHLLGELRDCKRTVLLRATRGQWCNPVMKKCNLGNGMRFTAILRRSQFNCPGKRRQQVTPLMAALTKWFRSPYVGVVSFNVLKHMSYNASLSSKKHS